MIWFGAKEVIAMKRAPLFFPRVFDDPETAKSYAASASSRGRQVGKIVAEGLTKGGFTRGRILEAGCGAGDLAIELAREIPNAEIIGLDLSEPLLELARSSSTEAGLAGRVSFEEGDIQQMPFQDGWFDVAVSLNTFHIVADPVAMLNEIERVISPAGRLLLSDIKRSWVGMLMPMLKTAYTLKEAQELLARSRLRAWKVYDRFFWFGVEACASGEFLSDRWRRMVLRQQSIA
jgi:ubiquinone/menaquinone biosynthesis C-methylase UbiE